MKLPGNKRRADRFHAPLLLLLLFALAALDFAACKNAARVETGEGAKVASGAQSPQQQPQRIISLSPSTTEVLALMARDLHLIALDEETAASLGVNVRRSERLVYAASSLIVGVTEAMVERLTAEVNRIEGLEGILSDWSLPGEHAAAAYDVARTVCRRAERAPELTRACATTNTRGCAGRARGRKVSSKR